MVHEKASIVHHDRQPVWNELPVGKLDHREEYNALYYLAFTRHFFGQLS